MSRLEDALNKFAAELNAEAKKLLTPDYGVSTGRLKNSLSFKIRRGFRGKKYIVFFAKGGEARSYAQYVHYGVSGTHRKRPNTPFRYKNKQPPKDAIAQWIVNKRIRLRDEKGRFIHITGEKGRKNIDRAAFLMARSIKRRGLKGVFYYSRAYEKVKKRWDGEMSEAMNKLVEGRFKARYKDFTAYD